MGQGQAGCGILAKGTEGQQLPHCWAAGSELPPAGTCHPSLGSIAVFATAVFRNQRAERLGNFWLRLLNYPQDARWRDGVVLTFAPCERQRFSPLTPQRCTPGCPVLSSRAAPKPCAATPSCTPRPHMPAGGVQLVLSPVYMGSAGSAGSVGEALPHAGAEAAGQPGHPPPPPALYKLPFPQLTSPQGHPGAWSHVWAAR